MYVKASMNGCHMGLSPARNGPSHNSLIPLWPLPHPPHMGLGGIIAYVCVLSRAWPDSPPSFGSMVHHYIELLLREHVWN